MVFLIGAVVMSVLALGASAYWVARKRRVRMGR